MTHSVSQESISTHSLVEKLSSRSLRKRKSGLGDKSAGYFTPRPPEDSENRSIHHPHSYHAPHTHRRHKQNGQVTSMTTEEIIDSIFNPRPHKEPGPFSIPINPGNETRGRHQDEEEEDQGLRIPTSAEKKRDRRPMNGRIWSTFRGTKGGGTSTPGLVDNDATPTGEKKFVWRRAGTGPSGKAKSQSEQSVSSEGLSPPSTSPLST